MTPLHDAITTLPWLEAIAERTGQIIWVLDHEDDIDADFLAIYHIDLDADEITARRYFALAHRLTAYSGVMAARAEAEREEQQPTRTTPTRTSSTLAPERGDGETREVSLTAFRMQFPGLVSMGGG
ncbi:hypothetical protein QA860_08360 [Streptomyces stelliscabiei]|uniref:hypothetical protein n=1 Tax=Streptomyces stelliscabiei TaxID=146820 RepID=UPI0029B43501|nr:hypothetical protein [Streptomyces stelliscabiei]MDX2550116.1 hypothetical protein [Streptomyces stelliscabiei]